MSASMHSEAVMHELTDRMVRILDTSEDDVSSDGIGDELLCILDRIVESVPKGTDPMLELQVGRFVLVFREALEKELSDYRLVQIAGTFRDYIDSQADDLVSLDDALYTFEYKMQNYAHYLFPDGSDNLIVSGLLEDREERLRTVSELMEEMGP